MRNGHAKTKKPHTRVLPPPRAHSKLTIPVSYGTVSFDDKAAHVPITIKRGELGSPSIGEADRNLCGRQLTATILARPEGAGATQPGMFGDDGDIQLAGIFEVGSLTVSPKKITATLEVSLLKLDRDKITRFAKREGLLTITHVHELEGIAPTEETND